MKKIITGSLGHPVCLRQGGILAAKVPRILAGRLEIRGKALNNNHGLLLRF